MKKILLIFICLVLWACDASATQSLPRLTSESSIPPFTPTATPKRISWPSLTPTVSLYSIPEWVKDSKHVLLLTVKSRFSGIPNPYEEVVFFNADSGEEYSIIMDRFEYAFWLNETHVGFLIGYSCSDYRYGAILDLSTGKVERYASSELKNKKFCPYPQYQVHAHFWEENSPVVSYNFITGTDETFLLQDNLGSNINAGLSPDYSTVVILKDQNNNYLGDKFQIYDFKSRQLRGESKVSNISRYFYFTQDSKKVVYLKGVTPCFLDLYSFEKNCGVSMKIPPPHLEGLSGDENKVIVQYDYFSGFDVYNGRLCIYGVFTGELNCPTEYLDIFDVETYTIVTSNGIETRTKGKFIAAYDLSVDERYLLLVYSYGCPGCDYFFDVGVAIVSVDGQKFYDLGEGFESIPNHIPQWRPSP